MPKTRTPRVGTIHPGLFCVIRPDGSVALFLQRAHALGYLRHDALKRGRATQAQRREAEYQRLRREVLGGGAQPPARDWDAVWVATLPAHPINTGPG